jgi:hypothetical protein
MFVLFVCLRTYERQKLDGKVTSDSVRRIGWPYCLRIEAFSVLLLLPVAVSDQCPRRVPPLIVINLLVPSLLC